METGNSIGQDDPKDTQRRVREESALQSTEHCRYKTEAVPSLQLLC